MNHTEHNEQYLEQMSNPEKGEHARSLLDLIDLGTFDLELAAWFISHISQGASYIFGSGPGGIGKTTTMRSMLSFVPANLRFVTALPDKVNEIDSSPHCVISDELSDHTPATYLWDQDVRDYFACSRKGHLLVANVHADDAAEVHEQMVTTNQVPESQFRSISIFGFICLEGGNPEGGRIKDTTTRRVVNKVFYSDGSSDHQSVYSPEEGLLSNAPRNSALEDKCRSFLQEVLDTPERTLEGVRKQFLDSDLATTTSG
jgi:hypothetical protein